MISVAHVYLRMMKYFLNNIAAWQPKCDCLEYNQFGRKVSGVCIIHQNLLKIIQVYYD